jgi:membrane associated rhomboid family serine protease
MLEAETDLAARKGLIYSILVPLLFVGLLWLVKLLEIASGADFAHYGLFPRSMAGLAGIFTAPLIHSDFPHLVSNSIPLLVMGAIILAFYRSIAIPVFLWIYFMTGLWVWAAGREVYHIGASGLVYGFVCFIFFSGLFRWDMRLLRPSLFVLLFYGSMVWGVLPLQAGVSWESHALGSLAGIITSFYFRKDGPQKKKFDWEDENDDEENPDDTNTYKDDNSFGTNQNPSQDPRQEQQVIRYIYIQRKAAEDAEGDKK